MKKCQQKVLSYSDLAAEYHQSLLKNDMFLLDKQ